MLQCYLRRPGHIEVVTISEDPVLLALKRWMALGLSVEIGGRAGPERSAVINELASALPAELRVFPIGRTDGALRFPNTMLVENDPHEVRVLRSVLRMDPDVVVADGVQTAEMLRALLQVRSTGYQVIATTDVSSAEAMRRSHQTLFGVGGSPSFGGNLRVHLSHEPVPHLEFVTPVSFTPTTQQLEGIEEVEWSTNGRVNPWLLTEALMDACLPHLLAGEALENALRLHRGFDGSLEELLEVATALTL